jgi:glutathione peroxidase
MAESIYEFSVNTINGRKLTLKDFKGKAMLIVNVASQCGLTPQYAALEKMYEEYNKQGLEVLGFPANEFGAQEPGSNTEIENFCTTKFGVKFSMFEKIVVKGEGQHPLYKHLINSQPTATLPKGPSFETKLEGYGIKRNKKDDILWNFEKFLVDRTGKVVARFSPDMTPDDPVVVAAIKSVL